MQKHNQKRHRGGGVKANANSRLPESVVESILHVIDRLDDKEDFALTYLKSEFLAKYCDESLVPASTRREAAIRKWYEVEVKNAATNARIRGMDRGYNVLPRVPFYTFLKFAQKLTREILGPLTNEMVVGSLSSGASTSRRRANAHPAQKLTGMADVTEGAMPYVDVIHHEVPLFRQHGIFYHLREVEGAVLFTVPKKTDIDRCACKEPDVNMFLQKAVGRHVRKQLRRFGVFLNDQSVNRGLARSGSLDGGLATLDLSSASDTMTISVVRMLLPEDWFLYLNDIRSHVVWVDGTPVRTEMFSSMGNGFTFELESLLFFVLMKSVAYFTNTPGVVSVYGDDIIIPSGMFDDACWVLNLFGFTPNPDKSFSDGLFRESCGGHYYSGEDVTPFYLRRRPERLTDLIRVANQLRKWSLSSPWRQHVWPELYQTWRELARHVPLDLWGGCDYAVDTQLVAPVSAQNRLVRVGVETKLPPAGLYMAWHITNWKRVSEPDEIGHPPAEDVKTYRRRRVRYGAPVESNLFVEEI